MLRKTVRLLIPLAGSALLLPIGAAPAHAAAPMLTIVDQNPGGRSAYILTVNTNATENILIKGTAVLSSQPIAVAPNTRCSAEVQVQFFNSMVWFSNCDASHGIGTWNTYLGDGNDTFVSDTSGGVYVEGRGGDDHLTVSSRDSFAQAYGQAGDDTITLQNHVGAGTAQGGPGADTINAHNILPDSIDCGPSDNDTDHVHFDYGLDALQSCDNNDILFTSS
jgi:hypothetical protein